MRRQLCRANSATPFPSTECSQYLNVTHGFDNSVNGLPIYAAAGGYTVAMWVKGAGQTSKYLFTEASTASTTPLLLLQTGSAANTNTHLDIYIRTTGGSGTVKPR